MDKITSVLKEKLLNEKGIKLIVILGIIGILLIMISSFIPEKKESTEKSSKSLDTSDVYREETEKKLAEILSSISGVGEVRVMLTVESTEEYVYAEEVKQSKTGGVDNKSQQNENKLVLIEQNGQKEALVQQIKKPTVSGVVVVCEGGGNATVCESIYKTVSTALGIPISNIYVAKIKQ